MGNKSSVKPKSAGPSVASGESAEQDAQETIEARLAVQVNKSEDIRDKYELGEVLGSGAFGQVRKATMKEDHLQRVRAVKIVQADGKSGEWSVQAILLREAGLLQDLKHHNIIRYYDFYMDIHFLYVVMELCTGGEVFAKSVGLESFTEADAAGLAAQMLSAIHYIHGRNIMHRDIKAENFMLSNATKKSVVKMIDFGLGCTFKPDQVFEIVVGTPLYMAPELVSKRYDYRVDVWAFGVLMYLLMYGDYPFRGDSDEEIMGLVLTEPIKWNTPQKFAPETLDFLKQLLVRNPNKRITTCEALNHPFVSVSSCPELARSMSMRSEAGDLKEVVRSAIRKVSQTKKKVDPEVEKLRGQKMKKINDDFGKGIRHGHRLGSTPNEDFMDRPECVRRANRLISAPGKVLTGELPIPITRELPIPKAATKKASGVIRRGPSMKPIKSGFQHDFDSSGSSEEDEDITSSAGPCGKLSDEASEDVSLSLPSAVPTSPRMSGGNPQLQKQGSFVKRPEFVRRINKLFTAPSKYIGRLQSNAAAGVDKVADCPATEEKGPGTLERKDFNYAKNGFGTSSSNATASLPLSVCSTAGTCPSKSGSTSRKLGWECSPSNLAVLLAHLDDCSPVVVRSSASKAASSLPQNNNSNNTNNSLLEKPGSSANQAGPGSAPRKDFILGPSKG